ncbi:transcription factor TRY-like isoform X2 [Camellia sinensis]|uniref:transcription factor TRY-like isoform X2 n=1 Tax=Camellia sinensis TaxID=4442 RepID=UPI001036F232|nr:transcription factor TRY-like isoform X2 [Camellia sinensis]
MDKRRRKQLKTSHHCCGSEEVSSIEWEFINMTEQEEDLICRMYKLVGESAHSLDVFPQKGHSNPTTWVHANFPEVFGS